MQIVQAYCRNHNQKMPIAYLCSKLGISLPATYVIVNTLERKGYLRRTTGESPVAVEYVYTMTERSFLSSIAKVNMAAYNFVDAETRDLINKLNREIDDRKKLV